MEKLRRDEGVGAQGGALADLADLAGLITWLNNISNFILILCIKNVSRIHLMEVLKYRMKDYLRCC